MQKILKETPWDRQVFNFPTYELVNTDEESFAAIQDVSGHITVKVEPKFPIERLQRHGFYYCDTLINPFCTRDRFTPVLKKEITVEKKLDVARLFEISAKAFTYGRFHRDFNIPRSQADQRYGEWFMRLAAEKKVFSLCFDGELAGFFGYDGNRIALHALGEAFRGKGLAKYFWSVACAELFKEGGHDEIFSSISADNMPVLNLYAALGFRFRNPLLCYHRFRK